MEDRFEPSLASNRTSSKSRRSYSQRNVSTLQHELTKNRKMINVKTTNTTTTVFNRTLSFKPLPIVNSSSSSSLSSIANVENTPIKIIPIKKLSFDFDTSTTGSSVEGEDDIIEETPVKEDENGNDILARDIQRLSLRLRSATPLYNNPVLDNQSTKPTTLHLSQVVNRASRCNYVLRRFVREAQKYSPKPIEIPTTSSSSTQSHDKGRRRLFVDSPKQHLSIPQTDPPPLTPRKASGVIKQLFSSPSSSLKRPLPSPHHSATKNDKRPRLF